MNIKTSALSRVEKKFANGIFLDEDTQRCFDENGYAVIPFYNKDQIKEFNLLYDLIQPKNVRGIFPSTYSKDKSYRDSAHQEICTIAQSSQDRTFKNYKIICGSFIVKYPGSENTMDVHQDMTLVDEKHFSGINIWVPLIDLNDNNGTLYILEGSHQLLHTYRGASIRPIYDKSVVSRAIRKLARPVYPKAGEAIVFDQSIIHFSEQNQSDVPRIVTNIFITQKEASILTAWHEPSMGSFVELFEHNSEFMQLFEQFSEDINLRPRMGKSVGRVPYAFPRINYHLLKRHYPGCIDRLSVLDRIRLSLL